MKITASKSQTAIARFMADKFTTALSIAPPASRVGYIFLVFLIVRAYFDRPQDLGLVRQEITFLQLFWLAFPLSLYVDFWIFVPLGVIDYLLGGLLSTTVSGRRELDDIVVLLLGAVNAVAGYYQWFTLVPRFVKKVGPHIRSAYEGLFGRG